MINHDVDQKSEQWHHLRKGKVTGTILKAIMGTPQKREDAKYEVIAERLTVGVDVDHENPMDRGTRLEPDAIAVFELQTGLKVERVGFSESDKNSQIANSPDGLIYQDDTNEQGQRVAHEAVEAKCMGGKNHVKMWLTNKIPDDYHWQVVQYFIVNENLQKLYFIGYNPDIPVHPLHIIEVQRDQVENDMVKASVSQEVFLEEVNAIVETLIEPI